MRTSLEERIELHRFAGIFPEQFSTEAGRHREAVVAADQRLVIGCFRDDLAGFVHDVSHRYSWWQSSDGVDLDRVRRPAFRRRTPTLPRRERRRASPLSTSLRPDARRQSGGMI
jgi:hypothetical protein